MLNESIRKKLAAVLDEEVDNARQQVASLENLYNMLLGASEDQEPSPATSHSWKSMKDACIAALADGQTLSLAEVTQRVGALGYKTKAKNPRQAVYQALNAYPRHFERVKKSGKGGVCWRRAD